MSHALASVLDRAIATISPQWGLNRHLARARLEYVRSVVTPTVKTWRQRLLTKLDPIEEGRATREEVLRIARRLDARNSWAHGVFNAIVDNVVGTGIMLESKISKNKKGDLDEPKNSRVEDEWNRWADRADVTGRRSFYELQRQVERELWVAGEVLVLRSVPASRRIPLALEVIEADRIDDSLDEELEGGGQIIQGVEFNASGEPVAYHVLSNDPLVFGDPPNKRQRVDADRALHVFHQRRPGEVRGVSRIMPVSETFEAFARLLDYELTASAMRSAFIGLLKRSGIETIKMPKGPDGDEVVDEHGNKVGLFPGGMLLTGGIDDALDSTAPAIQSAGLAEFSILFLRSISVGLNVSYELLARDFTKTNFSSARQSALEDRKHWEPRQRLLNTQFNDRVYEWFRDSANIAGVRPFAGPAVDMAERFPASWKMPGWIWVKPLEEAQATRMRIAMGLTSPQKEAAKAGTDLAENLRETGQALKLAEEQGLALDLGDASTTADQLEDSEGEDENGKNTPFQSKAG